MEGKGRIINFLKILHKKTSCLVLTKHEATESIAVIQIRVSIEIFFTDITGHKLAQVDTAADLHLLYLLVEHFFKFQRPLDVLHHQCRQGLIGGNNGHGTDTEEALPQCTAGIDIPDTVEENLFIPYVKEADG